MELKPGYKKTMVGVIPEDWACTTVREIASPVRNAIVGGPFGSELVSSDYVAYGVPVIRGQNMGEQWVEGDFVFVTAAKANSLAANLAKPGDIMFTQRGSLGQVSLVPDRPYERYLVSQSQMKLSVNDAIADPLFFCYLFHGEWQQEHIRQSTIQTGVPHTNLSILRDTPVALPPLSEQRAIAEALGDVDALISSLDRLIAKKRDMKQGAMQQLLTGRRRLPGFNGAWQRKRLGEIVPIRKGQLITETRVRAGSVPVIAGGKKPAYLHDRPNRTGKTITISASGASAGYVAFFDVPIFASDCSTISEGRGYSIEFVYYQLLLRQEEIYGRQTGGAQPHVHANDVAEIEIDVPPLREQTAIASVLSDMDAEIGALEERREKTRLIKQGMMQELLTGRIRLV